MVEVFFQYKLKSLPLLVSWIAGPGVSEARRCNSTQAEVTVVKEATKLEPDVYAIAEDVVMEELLKTVNANADADGIGGAETEGDEEPAACTTPTKA